MENSRIRKWEVSHTRKAMSLVLLLNFLSSIPDTISVNTDWQRVYEDWPRKEEHWPLQCGFFVSASHRLLCTDTHFKHNSLFQNIPQQTFSTWVGILAQVPHERLLTGAHIEKILYGACDKDLVMWYNRQAMVAMFRCRCSTETHTSGLERLPFPITYVP